MGFIDKLKKAATTAIASQSTSSKPSVTTSTPSASSYQTATATPSLAGNGNGESNLSTSNKFAYENSSLFDDTMNKGGKEAMQTIQGSSFFRGHNDSKNNSRMIKQLAQIQTDCKRWNVTMDADGDGSKSTTSLAQTVADSYDSVLDLYISEQVEAMMDKYGTGTKNGGYLCDAALEELAMKGIRADSVGDGSNRIYAFSLIDVKDDIRALIEKEVKTDAEKKQIYNAVYADDAVIMKDSNGKKGSCIFADCLVPDGSAQKCEINLASILDQMGYDCVSKADFIGKESDYMELISSVEANINDGSYHELNKGQQAQTIHDTYGSVKSVRQALNSLWGRDTSGNGKTYSNALGNGSDAYIVDNFSDGVSTDGKNSSGLSAKSADETQTIQNKNDKNKTKDKTKNNTGKSEKLTDKPKTQKDEIIKFAEKEAEKLLKDLFGEDNSDLSKANKLEISHRVVKSVNDEFKTNMTYNEIYDTIF